MSNSKRQRKRARANGEGTIYWSSYYDRFVAQATLGWENGKPVRRKLYGPRGDRSREARLGVEERLRPYQHARPSVRASRTITLSSLAARYIETAPIRANTKDYYHWMSQHFGKLGAKRILEITPVDVRRHLDGLDVGKRTKRGVYTLLHRVFREALQLELIARNPVSAVTAPRMPKPEMRALTPAEVGFLLEAVRGDRLESLVVLALTSTMGPAELLALRRRDVHLNAGYLWVTGDLVATSKTQYRPVLEETKTPRRRRRIDLPAVAIGALRQRLKLCLLENSGEFVFTTAQGGLIRLSSLRTYWWRPLVARAAELAQQAGNGDFPTDLRLYDLRHTAKALMDHAGVPLQIQSERMGHSSIMLTADVYGSRIQALHVDAAARLDALFEGLRT